MADTEANVTVTEANGNFPEGARLAGQEGNAVVSEDGRSKLPVNGSHTEPQTEMTDDEKIDFVAARILREHEAAFEELAK